MQRVSKTVKDEEGEIEVYDWEQWVRNRWRKWVKARAIITEERWQRSGGDQMRVAGTMNKYQMSG